MPDRRPTFADSPSARCGHQIGWIDCPTGGWWAHREHPGDGHEATPVVFRRNCPNPNCDLTGRLLGSGEIYTCDNRHFWKRDLTAPEQEAVRGLMTAHLDRIAHEQIHGVGDWTDCPNCSTADEHDHVCQPSCSCCEPEDEYEVDSP